jgi:hypothetical protein
LSEVRPDTVEEPAGSSAKGQALSSTERVFVRLTFWQTVLSVVGVFIALVALYAALKESAAVRQQTAAAVWPFVQMTIADHDSEESASFSMSFTNNGVGPARVHGVRLTIDGQPIRNWTHAVKVLDAEEPGAVRVSRNFISDRVLRPDETVTIVSTADIDLARRFQAAIGNPDNYITYCYCSIFDECWLADSRKNLHEPDLVEQCPDFGDATLRN